MNDEINQVVLGYVLTVLAVFLNYAENNQFGVFFAIVALGLSYFMEVLRVNNRGHGIFIPMSVLTILAVFASYGVYFLRISQNVLQH